MASRSTRRGGKRCNRRSNRRASRRNTRRSYGGSSPANVNDTSMLSPQRLSVAQGQQFADLTKNYHGGRRSSRRSRKHRGGMGPYPGAVLDSGLPNNLHASAHLLPLDKSFAEIQGMKDQAGGRRKRRGGRRTRSNRKYGGSGSLGFAPTDAPGMLLDAASTARAGLNPEWKLAENPNSFAPQ